jgi:RimJ/RimL family protein N-acetyltransferase
MLILATERLVIRTEEQGDLESLYAILKDPYTMRFYPKPYTLDEVKGIIDRNIASYKSNGFGLWALILKEEHIFIGQCGISIQNIDGKQVPEIGYHLNQDYWNNGYATEAAKACLNYGFEELKLPSLFIHTYVKNMPSIRVAQRIGMHHVKEYEKVIPNHHKTMRHVVFGLSKRD